MLVGDVCPVSMAVKQLFSHVSVRSLGLAADKAFQNTMLCQNDLHRCRQELLTTKSSDTNVARQKRFILQVNLFM